MRDDDLAALEHLRPLEGSGESRPRVHSLGLMVHDIAAAEAALARELRAPLPFPIVLTDGLLPGDPRAG